MTRKIRVLHIIKSLGRGGAEMLLPSSLACHDQSSFEFDYVYFLPWKDQLAHAISNAGGKVTCLSARNNFAIMLRLTSLCRYIRRNNIKVIHAHLPWAGIVAKAAGRLTGVPVIYTEHNKQERYHAGTRFMNLATMNLLTEIIGVSNDVSESIRKHKPDLKIPIRTILNGVDTNHFNRINFNGNEIRTKLGIPANAVVIGTVAVFRFQKRLDVWMDVASKILKQFPEVHFIIVGDGPLKNELIQRRATLGMEGRIHMPGLKTEVRPFLASFDLYMMTSIFEGLPIALLEAMAMECAIISTSAGGISEVIRNREDGLLCEVGEPERLIELGGELIKDSALRGELATRARQRVTTSFGIHKMVAELESVYRKNVASKPDSQP